jgi:hypothetical protein
MRILVSGGRDLTKEDWPLVRDTLETVTREFNLTYDDEYQMPDGNKIKIIHGGAKGADLLADDWCVVNWLVPEVHKADWNTFGKAAGSIRNQKMLDSGIDLVLAFPSKKSRGTWHMVRIAEAAGVPVRVYPTY